MIHLRQTTQLLFIGKCPPPIGGVTVHVERLRGLLIGRYPFIFFDLKGKNLLDLFASLISIRGWSAHLHSSRPALRFVFALASKAFGFKAIITYHGNLGRFDFIGNLLDYSSLALASNPLVLNRQSFRLAHRFNRNTIQISAFIPPTASEPLSSSILEKVSLSREKYWFIYCTNAYNVSFDKFGRETYGISDLLDVFKAAQHACLFVSDPSGRYLPYVESLTGSIPANIVFLSKPHSFVEVLKLSDAFVRNTTTDGDSISIWEALSLGKRVLATDVVDRPAGVDLYSSLGELRSLIIDSSPYLRGSSFPAFPDLGTIAQFYIDLYDS